MFLKDLRFTFLILSFTSCLFIFGCSNGGIDFSQAEKIISNIKKTSFPSDTFNIVSFGAKGDGLTDDRSAIMEAVAECAGNGGGVVLLPKGTYFSKGPISLKSNVNLHLAKGSLLLFSSEPTDFLPAVFTRFEGVEIFNYSPMIYTVNQENIAITGSGVIDGGGEEKWVPFRAQQKEAQTRIRFMSDSIAPLYKRVFGEGDFIRSSFIQFIYCKQILVEGVTLINSPFWMIHPVYCEDIIIRDVVFNSMIINNDGIDFDSCNSALVEGCVFDTGDDAVVFKSGRDGDAWRVNRPTKDIVVRNCTAPNVLHGIAFGSEMSGGLENIYVENLSLGKVKSEAIQFKSNKDRGSYMSDIFIRNIEVDSAGSHLIFFTNSYHSYRGGDAPTAFHHIYLENISCNFAKNVIQLQGLPEMPLHDIYINGVNVKKADRIFSKQEYFNNVFLNNFIVEGEAVVLNE